MRTGSGLLLATCFFLFGVTATLPLQAMDGHTGGSANRFWVAKSKSKKVKTSSTTTAGGESEATKRGREEHKNWQPGEGYEKEVILPSGKRADAVNWEKQDVKELKPDNPRAIRHGEKQLEGYKKELEETTGEEWTGTVETYKK
ncbi:MAG TPA: hypothetical protein VK539_34675 [Myxococcaceae bacterium]|nr:hypothetical protein [Myxococcaceae bacterium]